MQRGCMVSKGDAPGKTQRGDPEPEFRAPWASQAPAYPAVPTQVAPSAPVLKRPSSVTIRSQDQCAGLPLRRVPRQDIPLRSTTPEKQKIQY
jgi:hypothetical protein